MGGFPPPALLPQWLSRCGQFSKCELTVYIQQVNAAPKQSYYAKVSNPGRARVKRCPRSTKKTITITNLPTRKSTHGEKEDKEKTNFQGQKGIQRNHAREKRFYVFRRE